MRSFLEEIAEALYQKHGKGLSEMTVVLPSRRAGLFFRYALAPHLEGPMWMPTIHSIEEFVADISGKKSVDSLSLLFEFYTAYLSAQKGEPESFESFANWAEVLLHDFNEIDRYLIDPKHIFSYLKEAKRLERWTLNVPDQKSTEMIDNYLLFWDKMGLYYQALSEQLLSQGKAYQGLTYRLVHKDIQEQGEQWLKNLSSDKILFLGLNALNKAEEEIIQFLLKHQRAEIYWDADSYYVKNAKHEAGHFLRKHFNNWPVLQGKRPQLSNHFTSELKEVKAIGVSGNIAQSKLAGQLLQTELSPEKDPKRTALVLADEQLLLPVLQSIPESIEKVNVTMGYPLRYVPQTAFFELLFRMKTNAQKYADEGKAFAYYHKDVLALSSHSYTQCLLGDTGKFALEVKKNNRTFIKPEALIKEFGSEFSPLIFGAWTNIDAALEESIQLINALGAHYTKNHTLPEASMEREYLFHFSKVFKKLQTLQSKYGYLSDLKTLLHIFRQLLQQESLDFYGEPLEGLQVMGVLETRALDFDTLILTSVNEGVLPSGKTNSSLIPYDIKLEMGLPTHWEKDAVYAYHFYRLIQRAKKVYLVYNTQQEVFGGGEQSRFITQIQEELYRLHPQSIQFSEEVYTSALPDNTPKAIIKQKSPAVMERLEQISERGFSPSAMSTYISCPLKYYYEKVLGLKEDDEVEESLDARTLGTVVHECLEVLYTPLLNTVLTEDLLKPLLTKVDVEIEKQFEKHYVNGNMEEGYNLLVLRVAKNYARKLIEFDIRTVKSGGKLIFRGLETELNGQINVNGQARKLMGYADRTDELNGRIRIIDYKTGMVNKTELSVNQEGVVDAKKSKAFQLACYKLMSDNPEGSDGGIISFKNMKEGVLQLKVNKMTEEDFMQDFEASLVNMLSELFDSAVPFTQTDDHNNCRYCDFKEICGR